MLGSVAAVVGPLTALLWDRLNRIEDRIERLSGKFGSEVEEVKESLENRIDNVEKRLENIERRVNNIEERLGNVENRLVSMEKRFTNIESELSGIRIHIYELSRSMIGFSNTLIDVLAIKNVITQSEAAAPNSRNNRAKQEETKPRTKPIEILTY